MCLFTANVLHIIYTYICTYLLQAHTAWGFCMGCDHDCLFRAAAFSWGQWIYETRCKLCLVVKHFKDVTRFVPIYMKVIYTFLLPLMSIYIYIHMFLPFEYKVFALNPAGHPSRIPSHFHSWSNTCRNYATWSSLQGRLKCSKQSGRTITPVLLQTSRIWWAQKIPWTSWPIQDLRSSLRSSNHGTVWSIYNCEVWIFNVPYKGFKA